MLFIIKDRVMNMKRVLISKNCLIGCITGSVYLPRDVVVAQVSYSLNLLACLGAM